MHLFLGVAAGCQVGIIESSVGGLSRQWSIMRSIITLPVAIVVYPLGIYAFAHLYQTHLDADDRSSVAVALWSLPSMHWFLDHSNSLIFPIFFFLILKRINLAGKLYSVRSIYDCKDCNLSLFANVRTINYRAKVGKRNAVDLGEYLELLCFIRLALTHIMC